MFFLKDVQYAAHRYLGAIKQIFKEGDNRRGILSLLLLAYLQVYLQEMYTYVHVLAQ